MSGEKGGEEGAGGSYVEKMKSLSLSLSRLGTMGYDVRVRKRTRLTSGDSPSN